jgi:dihydroorotate dehydrogenase
VKLSPDLGTDDLDRALGAALDAGIDGIIATNTTLDRPGLHSPRAAEPGGLSGAPLASRSLAALGAIVARFGGEVPVISCGGVMSPADARARIEAGAALVQVYTGMVYRGPRLLREVAAALR